MDLQRNENLFLDPAINLFGKCPVCHELVSMKVENEELALMIDKCHRCGAILDLEEILPSVHNHFVITQAISTANAFWASDYALLVFAFQIVIRTLTFLPMWLAFPVSLVWFLPLLGIVRWFIKHGKWNSEDEEYLDAKKKMRWSFMLWSAANVLNVLHLLTVEGLIR